MAQVSQSSLASHVTAVNPLYAARIQSLKGLLQAGGADPVQAAQRAQAFFYDQMLRQSAMVAYIDVFRMLAWLCVGLIPLMFFMKPAKPRAGPAAPMH
jgi:DHA2 family multidrug resistance protein